MTWAATSLLGEEDEARAAYPGPTWGRLRELKHRYDPEVQNDRGTDLRQQSH
jgi:hypothetical protein